MSVKRTVARTRSVSGKAPSRCPVTNSSMSPISPSHAPAKHAPWGRSPYSMYFASGIAAASFRPSASGTSASARLCRTSAGTRTLGRTDVTSIRRFINMSVLKAPGLHDRRSNLPNSAISRSFPSWVPITRFIDRPVPHAATVAVTKASNASSVTENPARTKPPTRTRCDTRSGYVAANNTLMGQPSENPSRIVRFEPTASMTARTSSIRSSSDGTPDTRSDRPCPLLSNVTTRANPDKRCRNAVNPGSSWWNSTWEIAPGTMTMSSGPCPIV